MYLSQTENMPRSNILTGWEQCFSEWQLAASFMHFELGRKNEKDYMMVGEGKLGIQFQHS